MFSNIGVVGAGAMGTAISQTICENTQNVLFIICCVLISYPVYDWIVKVLDKLIYIKKE